MKKLLNTRRLKKRLIADGVDRKQVNLIVKSSGKYNKVFNTTYPNITFVDAQGDSELMSKFIELAKKHGREDDVFVLDFSEGKGGSLNPETGEFTPSDEAKEKIKKLIDYIDSNCSKKVTSISVSKDELTLKIYGGLDDAQIERIVDNFIWIYSLEFDNDSEVTFSIEPDALDVNK